MVGAEVGVLCGRLSADMLRQIPRLHLVMVDLWRSPPEDGEYVRTGDPLAMISRESFSKAKSTAMKNVAFAEGRYTVIQQDSAEAAGNFPDSHFDFVFIDACHARAACYRDIVAWCPKVNRGCLLCGHDYNVPGPTGRFGVKEAVDQFVEEHKLNLILGQSHTWFTRIP